MAFRWLAVLILLGCSGRARVHAPGEIWLEDIRIDGNKAIPDKDLIPGLALRRAELDGLRTDPYQLSLDTKRIRGAYVRLGFFEATVESRIDRKGNAEIVVFTVVEGPRSKARVSVTGLPAELPEEAVFAKLELKEGAPFDYDLYDDGKEIVKGMVEEVGYPHVDLDESNVTVDRKSRVAAASYRVVLSGPRANFGPVKIVGLENYPDLEGAVRGRLTIREGELYSPRVLAETSRGLYELGRFGQVRIDPDRSARAAVVPVTISIQFRPGTESKIGVGVGFDSANYEGRVRGGFTYVPNEYPLWSVALDGRVALNHPRFGPDQSSVDFAFGNFQPRIRLFLNFQRLEMLRPYVIGDFGGGFDFFTVEAYTAFGPVLRSGASFPLGVRWLTAQLGWAFSAFQFTNVVEFVDPLARNRLGLRGTEVNGRFEQAIAADLRDKPQDPRKGAFFGVRLTEAGLFSGSEYGYLQAQPDVRAYVPIRRQSVLAFRLRGGSFFGDVPVTQRFFSGGAQSHRGFGARNLAPDELAVDEKGDISSRVPIGGTAFLETGAELRVPLRGKPGSLQFGVTLFLDGGDNTSKLEDIDPSNLHWAAGFGFFIKYGGFKLRIDFGHKLNRKDPENTFIENSTWFLAVGETF